MTTLNFKKSNQKCAYCDNKATYNISHPVRNKAIDVCGYDVPKAIDQLERGSK